MSLIGRFLNLSTKIARVSLVLGALSVSAYVSADSISYGDTYHQTSSDCCFQDCCDAPQCDYAYNPSAHHKCGCSTPCDMWSNFSGRVDFLWWRPCSDGLQLGTEETSRSNTDGDIVFDDEKTSVKDFHFNFDAGFRLGLGYYCPSNCWDIALNWTHFHSKAHASGFSDRKNGVSFVSDWERFFGFLPDEQRARWSLDLDMIDLEFAQMYYINHCFVVRPHFGLRAARIDQSIRIESESFTEHTNFFHSFQSTTHATNDFKGIGPRVGLDLEVKLGCNFVLYGQGAAALVYGKFDRSSSEDLAFNSGLLGATSEDFLYEAKAHNERCTIGMSDLTFGLRWEDCFECCNRYHPIALSVAWEQHAFYDLNNFSFVPGEVGSTNSESAGNAITLDRRQNGRGLVSSSSEKRGNLTTQGLTASLMLGF